MGIIEGIIASLIAALIIAYASFYFGKQTYEKRVESAVDIYADHLDKLIREANTESGSEIRVAAQAIVSTRNDLRSSLVSLNSLLNSDIDVLAEMLAADASAGQFSNRLKVLEKKWPAKRDQVKVELRKLLAELGLVEK
ncbi:hypothetical protein ABH313_00630 [Chromobacterium vaccinii]|uniref:hypothetical protein n=1 Tax=Chromobacterium vaccinii TaxID=1108595 RepID=UPI0032612BFE